MKLIKNSNGLGLHGFFILLGGLTMLGYNIVTHKGLMAKRQNLRNVSDLFEKAYTFDEKLIHQDCTVSLQGSPKVANGAQLLAGAGFDGFSEEEVVGPSVPSTDIYPAFKDINGNNLINEDIAKLHNKGFSTLRYIHCIQNIEENAENFCQYQFLLFKNLQVVDSRLTSLTLKTNSANHTITNCHSNRGDMQKMISYQQIMRQNDYEDVSFEAGSRPLILESLEYLTNVFTDACFPTNRDGEAVPPIEDEDLCSAGLAGLGDYTDDRIIIGFGDTDMRTVTPSAPTESSGVVLSH